MTKPRKEMEYITDFDIPLEDWLRLLLDPSSRKKYIFIDWQFPSNKQLQEYLETIHTRSDAEIKDLLRCFLINTGSLGNDSKLLDSLISTQKFEDVILNTEFGRRMMRGKPWEGITWILDLLPAWPQSALNALNAYISAHASYLPDGRHTGLFDAATVIRCKYLLAVSPKDVLDTISPREFEYLIAALFRSLGYTPHVTQQSRDGGADIVCWKQDGMVAESLLVECKHHSGRIGVDTVRQIAGTVSDLGASRGFVVTSSSFTKPAIDFANKTGRIQLIDFNRLNVEMNTHIDTRWVDRLPKIVAWEQERQSKETSLPPNISSKVAETLLKTARTSRK